MAYERLKMEYPHIEVVEKVLPKGLAGFYYDNIIEINKYRSKYEKHGILAEELGHHETTYGDITKLDCVTSRKLELVARRWGYQKIVSLDKLIECYISGYNTIEDICNHLEITANYLHDAIKVYYQKYGLSIMHTGYKIYFNPLNIEKVFF